MPRKAVWITYDLGIKGDYEGMYSFLDRHNAKECGDSVAFLNFDFSVDIISEFTDAIRESVDLDKRSRVYLVYPDPEAKGYKGRFILGTRKSPPWAGFGMTGAAEEDVGE